MSTTETDSIGILQRLMHLGLSFPGFVVLIKNLIATDFDLGYLGTCVVRNFNTEHTCLGILMWSVLHFDQYPKLVATSDSFKLGAVCCFTLLVMTTDISFYKCILYDLSVWTIAGCLTIFDRCFRVERLKRD